MFYKQIFSAAPLVLKILPTQAEKGKHRRRNSRCPLTRKLFFVRGAVLRDVCNLRVPILNHWLIAKFDLITIKMNSQNTKTRLSRRKKQLLPNKYFANTHRKKN